MRESRRKSGHQAKKIRATGLPYQTSPFVDSVYAGFGLHQRMNTNTKTHPNSFLLMRMLTHPTYFWKEEVREKKKLSCKIWGTGRARPLSVLAMPPWPYFPPPPFSLFPCISLATFKAVAYSSNQSCPTVFVHVPLSPPIVFLFILVISSCHSPSLPAVLFLKNEIRMVFSFWRVWLIAVR